MTSTITARRTLADLVDDADGRVVCLAMSKDPNAKVTVLLFRPGEDLPWCVAKVPTTDAAVRRIQLEAGRLTRIGRRELGPLADTIPRIVAMAEHLGRPVLVTTALPGRVMLAAYHTWRHTARPAAVQADFNAAGEWLAELQLRTSSGHSDLASMLDGIPAAISRRFGDDPGTADDLDQLAALRGRMAGHQVARVIVHGDFWPGNLLMANGRVRASTGRAPSRMVCLPATWRASWSRSRFTSTATPSRGGAWPAIRDCDPGSGARGWSTR